MKKAVIVPEKIAKGFSLFSRKRENNTYGKLEDDNKNEFRKEKEKVLNDSGEKEKIINISNNSLFSPPGKYLFR